ncbi:hypothetical protein JW979_00275 [bacterium]|nr:hypothetical protein [candidate division CSSED10-310 bacterium]
MCFKRCWTVFITELTGFVKGPMFWFILLVIVFLSFGLSGGNVRIVSGDAEIGGTKAWITSEYAMAFLFSILGTTFYFFFISIAAGMSVIRDQEQQVTELLQSTPMKPSEYIWGKYLAIFSGFGLLLMTHLVFSIFFNHAIPNADTAELRGPFQLMNYVRPIFIFALPSLIFYSGISFWIGERTRRPILVFFFPVVVLLILIFFVWEWSPEWLDPKINAILMMVDPSGFRWLDEVWLKVDKGAEFYNTQLVRYDGVFIVNRMMAVFLGLGAVLLSSLRFAKVQGCTSRRHMSRKLRKRKEIETNNISCNGSGVVSKGNLLNTIPMTTRVPAIMESLWVVFSSEMTELFRQPGLYLFIPLVLLQTLTSALFALGPFDTYILSTPGIFAVRTMNTLTFLGCLLLLFYLVESLMRDKRVRLAEISMASPVQTSALLLGKILANMLVMVVLGIVVFLTGILTILIQGKVSIDAGPFLLVFGGLLIPTYLAWSAFITFVYALLNNRYLTYASGLALLIFTGYRQVTGQMNWVGNWDLWSVLRWSDMGVLDLNGYAILLNRIFVLSLGVLCFVLATKLFRRRSRDQLQRVFGLHPRTLFKSFLAIFPFIAIPAIAGSLLFWNVYTGFQGGQAEKAEKDYWRQNVATFIDVNSPDITHLDAQVVLHPETRHIESHGRFDLKNTYPEPMYWITFTGGHHWENVSWTLNENTFEPENRSGLYVFKMNPPLQQNEELSIGFSFDGKFPEGITKNGGGTMEFILPSGVVLTSFSPSFLPVQGFVEGVGVDEENRYDSKVYKDDFYHGLTDPLFGSRSPFSTHISIKIPSEYQANSVGRLIEKHEDEGMTEYIYESDYPVRFVNIVAGKWAVREDDGVALYYHPEHTYNLDEIFTTMKASLKHYSEWYAPYPWEVLRISEFPGIEYYAQGFPTNITFSENIGFLTQDDPKTNLVFMVTAHEISHQWWANILTPGKGPGGNVLAEGMAHFSTMLLLDAVKGPYHRMEFCKRVEGQYCEQRVVDSERSLVKVDGSKPGDSTVMYNKGSWVFYMLYTKMGRQAFLEGLRYFIQEYRHGPDYPVLQDFLETMRNFAGDVDGFDAFADQWFFDTVMPCFSFKNVSCAEEPSKPQNDADYNSETRWRINGVLCNTGTGTVTVDVAAETGKRFAGTEISGEYRAVRERFTVSGGAEQPFEFMCPFKPDRLTVDPDVEVLQLSRKAAEYRF